MLFDDNDCNQGKHTFPSSKSRHVPKYPSCIYCGQDVVNWNRVRSRNPEDIDFVLSELRKEKERAEAWSVDIDLKAKNHALRKGIKEFRIYAKKRLIQLVGRVYDLGDVIKRPYRDGYQTPYTGNLVYYAQHATACCCRPCISMWHGIPQGADLRDDEVDYLCSLIMCYVLYKLPEIQETGVHIPPIRKKLDIP